MMNMENKLRKAIEKIQKQLIKKVKIKGIYEDFGQKECDGLIDKFIDQSNYSNEMNSMRNRIHLLREWCENYNG